MFGSEEAGLRKCFRQYGSVFTSYDSRLGLSSSERQASEMYPN